MSHRKFPNALVIMIGFVLFASLLTYIIPHGQYQREFDPELNYERVVPGSFEIIEANPVTITQIFMSFPQGLIERADLIVLILLIGGSFYVIEKTGALKEGVVYLSEKLKGKEEYALIVVSVLFAAAGALMGMQEEVIAMTPVLLFFTRKLGYNVFVTIAISYGSTVIGSSFSPMNPFAVVIAQKVTQLPFLSGAGFRVMILLLAVALWTFLAIWYGNKNRIEKEVDETQVHQSLTGRSKLILTLVLLAFVVMVYGILALDWGFNEMSAEFFVVGIVVGLIGKLGLNGTSEAYIEGFKEMVFAAMIVGFSSSISMMLEQGTIIDTIIYGLFAPLQYLPTSLSAVFMMVSQSILHFAVPSYSGQAILTMSVLAPLSDLIGLSRQVCVLAYQYGAVMMDMVIPTNGALMAILAIARVSYNNWIRFVWKSLLMILILGAIAIVVGVFVGL